MEAGIIGMTVSEAWLRPPKGQVERYRGSEFTVEFLQKLKIEVVVEDDRVKTWFSRSQMLHALVKSVTARSSPVESVVRIRTGDRDNTAL